MPIYEYHCEACGKDFEEQQPMNFTASDTECPHCYLQKSVRKISSFASSIKGPNRKPRSSDIKAEQAIQRIEQSTTRLPPPFGKRGDYEPTP
jgi:putative FmdB family regulatory protein